MNEITTEKKIEALERIVKAIFGRQSKEITYSQNCEDVMQVKLECDLDDAIKNLSSLHIANIETDFYTGERELSKEEIFTWSKPWEGYTEITMYLETDYWEKSIKLGEENKKLKEELASIKNNALEIQSQEKQKGKDTI
jgi:hypothetical protein